MTRAVLLYLFDSVTFLQCMLWTLDVVLAAD